MRDTIPMLLAVFFLGLIASGYGRVLDDTEQAYFDGESAEVVDANLSPRDGRQLGLFSPQPQFVRVPFPWTLPSISPVRQSGSFQIPENPCWNSDGKFGQCMHVSECYPYVKAFGKKILEETIMEESGTCAFFNKLTKSGERGVCCVHKNSTQPNFVPPQMLPMALPDIAAPMISPVNSFSKGIDAEQVESTKATTAAERQAALRSICGFRGSGGKIVGGVRAEPGEWPWMAAMMNGNKQFCGGSLIDSLHILTAAHCVAHLTSTGVANLRVRLNEYNIKQDNEGLSTLVLRVRRVVRHKRFDGQTLFNDIALLVLEREVPFGPGISPVCLPPDGLQDKFAGTVATVTGWGSLRDGGPQPDVLMKVNVTIQTNARCSQDYGNDSPGGIIDTFLCAKDQGRDSCSGDSGGPLVIPTGPQWTQIGVVSWGIGCGQPPYPGVYTRVTSFMRWIQANMVQ